MPRVRKPVYPDLGAFFIGLRTSRKIKQAQAAAIAQRRGIPLSYQTLRGLETGETKNPSASALQAIASLYDVPYEEVVSEVVRHAFGLHLNVEDNKSLSLDTEDEGTPEDFLPVRLLTDRIAAGSPLTIDEKRTTGHLAFSKRSLRKAGINAQARLICVRVGRHDESMLGTIDPGDVVLLDCTPAKREDPRDDRVYAVNVPDQGATLKRVARIQNGLALISDNPNKEHYGTFPLHVPEGESILSVIVGEAVWRGQYIGGKR